MTKEEKEEAGHEHDLFDIISVYANGQESPSSTVSLDNVIDSWYLFKILLNNKIDNENHLDTKNPTKKFWTQFRRWVESKVTHRSLEIERYQLSDAFEVDHNKEACFYEDLICDKDNWMVPHPSIELQKPRSLVHFQHDIITG